jgi:hypothetical protein
VRAAVTGLAKHFPDRRAVIVNSDGGSTDGTQELVASVNAATPRAILVRHPLTTAHKIITPYHGVPGKGSAFRTIFAIAKRLGVRACAVVDSDLRSISPAWIELLLGPVVHEGFDYVSPLYLRHKYDGTITNSIVYPLTRALYGREVRQPIGGDFGFSGRLAAHYLEREVWDSDVARFGIDIWMTTTALADGFEVCESFLGAKIHDPKDPGSDLAGMFVQVVSSVFDLMHVYRERWDSVEGAQKVPLFASRTASAEPVAVDLERMSDLPPGHTRTGVRGGRRRLAGRPGGGGGARGSGPLPLPRPALGARRLRFRGGLRAQAAAARAAAALAGAALPGPHRVVRARDAQLRGGGSRAADPRAGRRVRRAEAPPAERWRG